MSKKKLKQESMYLLPHSLALKILKTLADYKEKELIEEMYQIDQIHWEEE